MKERKTHAQWQFERLEELTAENRSLRAELSMYKSVCKSQVRALEMLAHRLKRKEAAANEL